MWNLNREGFTLLETVVAISLVAIALLAVFKLHLQTLSISGKTKFYSLAPLLAEKKLSELRLKSYDEFSEFSGNFDEDFPAYKWDMEVEDVDSDILEDIAGRFEFGPRPEVAGDFFKIIKNFKRIDIKISGSGKLTYELRAYLFLNEKDKK